MTDEEIEDIRQTYRAASFAVGLPMGWDVVVDTTQWCYDQLGGMEAELAKSTDKFGNEATCMLVDGDGVAHIMTEHKGRVKQVHAERQIKETLDDVIRPGGNDR